MIQIFDIDLPISLRKQTQSYTITLFQNLCITYNVLSTRFRAFTTHLDSIVIPGTILEAFEILIWKEAVMEEMRALKKMRPRK